MAYTGGTTGSAFGFYTTNQTLCEQWAVWWRYRRSMGIKFGQWCGLFGGKAIVPKSQTNPPFWRVIKPCRQVYCSGYHLNRSNYLEYVRMLSRRQIKWLHGYPSNIASLAAYMVSDGIRLPMNYVTTGSEQLLEHQADVIREAFGVSPIQPLWCC